VLEESETVSGPEGVAGVLLLEPLLLHPVKMELASTAASVPLARKRNDFMPLHRF
jgi:hypothetical protein